MKYDVMILLLLSLLSGCTSTNKMLKLNKDDIAQQLNVFSQIRNANTSNKIVFLTFEVTVNDGTKDQYSFRLVHKIFADGRLKKSPYSSEPVLEQNYFYCELANANSQRLELIKTENPLQKVYEFPGDEKDLGKQVITQQKGQFTIRFQYSEVIKYLSIFKPGSTEPKTLKKIYNAVL